MVRSRERTRDRGGRGLPQEEAALSGKGLHERANRGTNGDVRALLMERQEGGSGIGDPDVLKRRRQPCGKHSKWWRGRFLGPAVRTAITTPHVGDPAGSAPSTN